MKFDFDDAFAALTEGRQPFPWQRALFERLRAGDPPASCIIPTGLGKTSVIALWLLARIAGATLPRRLVYVVNRRTVVDQTTDEVKTLRRNYDKLAEVVGPLPACPEISTLRGQMADNRAWSRDPSAPAVICGTVDMIGSRLLFSGYRIGFRTRPLHAGFLGHDALLVHDEAHLEPAFQTLLTSIEAEQRRSNDLGRLRVMELTATSRTAAAPFEISDEDRKWPPVHQRLYATKKLFLHPANDKSPVADMAAKAESFLGRNAAVLVFLRTVNDVKAMRARLEKLGAEVTVLTGTMRGYERERLVVESDVFKRFLHGGDESHAPTKTVFLIATSAGEVGVDLSADHLLCDLSTFDSMAQRFGRVNRFGRKDDSEIHVFHPATIVPDAKKPLEERRLRTLDLLRELDGNASPAALSKLDGQQRQDAFAPSPDVLPATDILFDAWAMTTIRDLAGRPSVAPYLHGVTPPEDARTQVAWRDDVDRIQREDHRKEYPPERLLSRYPLKPHELLSDTTARVAESIVALAEKHATPDNVPLWVVDDEGHVEVLTLRELIDRDTAIELLTNKTLLLPPSLCSPQDGLLTETLITETADGSAAIDVADEWFDADGKRLRRRLVSSNRHGAPEPGFRLVWRIALTDERDERDDDDDASPRYWFWYERQTEADNAGSRTGTKTVLLDVHLADVERQAVEICSGLGLSKDLGDAVVMAARLHDIGKKRHIWQRSVGNRNPDRVIAKAGPEMASVQETRYRHELGSVLDARAHTAHLPAEQRELVLHLIAAHHGRARPNFPADELFDPEVSHVDMRGLDAEVVTRFASLQKRYGRWGLAYLESLVRAADYAASAAPSEVEEA